VGGQEGDVFDVILDGLIATGTGTGDMILQIITFGYVPNGLSDAQSWIYGDEFSSRYQSGYAYGTGRIIGAFFTTAALAPLVLSGYAFTVGFAGPAIGNTIFGGIAVYGANGLGEHIGHTYNYWDRMNGAQRYEAIGVPIASISGGYFGSKFTPKPPERIYSARELMRRTEEPGPYHNFPESFNQSIFSGNRQVISDSYILYTRRGIINGRTGTFEIGVRPSTSGRIEAIVHRFFQPD
jgi:hypothetical protein